MVETRTLRGIFITGTDTNVGKTVVSAILCSGMQADYWKPVQSGCVDETDANWIKCATGLPPAHFLPECYRLQQPLSPHLAATIDGITIDTDRIRLPEHALVKRDLIVEGAGGLLVPLNRETLMIDLIAQLALPVIVVARSTLGTINHSLLTLAQLREYSIPVLGVVLNGPLNAENAEAISHYGRTNIIAQVPPLTQLSKTSLTAAFDTHFGDWYDGYSSTPDLSNMAPIYSNENGRTALAGTPR